jgi:hypothetical protein
MDNIGQVPHLHHLFLSINTPSKPKSVTPAENLQITATLQHIIQPIDTEVWSPSNLIRW